MARGAQMDLFESLPPARDDRDGWIQADLFFAAAETAREARLNTIARPKMTRWIQSPLISAAMVDCGIGTCTARFSDAGRRIDHVTRAHPKPAPAKVRAVVAPDTEEEIRARIRARMSGSGGDAGEDRREGAVA